jgi:hypothetical protein
VEVDESNEIKHVIIFKVSIKKVWFSNFCAEKITSNILFNNQIMSIVVGSAQKSN